MVVDVPKPEPISFWREIVREFQPELSDAEVNDVLAETSWPLADKEKITSEIKAHMLKGGFRRITNGS